MPFRTFSLGSPKARFNTDSATGRLGLPHSGQAG
jgi:hypothetical protein